MSVANVTYRGAIQLRHIGNKNEGIISVTDSADQRELTASPQPSATRPTFQRVQSDQRPAFQRTVVSTFNASATHPAPLRPQPQQPAVSRPVVPDPSPTGAVLPAADAGQTLLDLLQISTRESSRRPATSSRQQRPRVTGVQPRSRQVSPVVPSILTQVAALGRPRLTQVAPLRRPGLTQEASLRRPAGRRLPESTTRGTFFPVRPRQDLQPGVNRLERLNKSLSSPLVTNQVVRPPVPAPKIRFPSRKARPEPVPLRSGVTRRQGVRSAAGGWRPVSRPVAGADPRCPRCLAALIANWDDCFPCVSVLR